MTIELLIIGNEILTGRREDSHLKTTIATCSKYHLRVSAAHFIGDDKEYLKNYYRHALENEITVLSFGGIGITPDDKTRQAVAEAAGVELCFHPEGDALLREKFTTQYNNQRRQLIAFPQGSALIPNPINGIPGFSYHHIHCVPGFPQMAAPMIEWVLNHYCLKFAQRRIYQALTVFAPESQLAPLMTKLEELYPAVTISSLPKLYHETEFGFDGIPEQLEKAKEEAKKIFNAAKIIWTEENT